MPFNFKKLKIEGLVVIEPRVFPDERGYFMETYKESDFVKAGINEKFSQDNHSYSGLGVLRGLHFQKEPFAQGKLVRVINGTVWDVAVDLRKGSPTYLRWHGEYLNGENNKMFYIPPGFAHGFVVLTENTHILYKCTNEYNKQSESGIRWNDPDIAIKWPYTDTPVVSKQDQVLPFLKDLK